MASDIVWINLSNLPFNSWAKLTSKVKVNMGSFEFISSGNGALSGERGGKAQAIYTEPVSPP